MTKTCPLITSIKNQPLINLPSYWAHFLQPSDPALEFSGQQQVGIQKRGHSTHLATVRFILGRTGFYKLCVLHSQTCFSHLPSCLAGSCSSSSSSWNAPVRTTRLGRWELTQFVLNGQVWKKGDRRLASKKSQPFPAIVEKLKVMKISC